MAQALAEEKWGGESTRNLLRRVGDENVKVSGLEANQNDSRIALTNSIEDGFFLTYSKTRRGARFGVPAAAAPSLER